MEDKVKIIIFVRFSGRVMNVGDQTLNSLGLNDIIRAHLYLYYIKLTERDTNQVIR